MARSIKFVFAIFLPLVFCSQLAQAACFVKVDLTCNPAVTEDGVSNPLWAAKSVVARAELLYSSSVQNDVTYCELYSRVVAQECRIKEPVQFVFTEPGSDLKTNAFVIPTSFDLKANLPHLPQEFTKYFQSNGLEELTLSRNDTLSRLNSNSQNKFVDFFSPSNIDEILEIPVACADRKLARNPLDEAPDNCGLAIKCIGETSSSLGSRVEIEKGPTKKACSSRELLYSALELIDSMDPLKNGAPILKARYYPPKDPNFNSFPYMPVIHQSDGWLQGLTLQKYGIDLTVPGLCLPTANAMIALALKHEAPLSFTSSLFDTRPNIYGDGVATVRGAKGNTTTQLQYSGFATYVDEMMRIGGLLSKDQMPNKVLDYQKFFETEYASEHPQGFWHFYGATPVGLESMYEKTLHKLQFIEANVKSFVNDRKGILLALQAWGYNADAANQSEGFIGHANAVRGYSGDVLITHDPWGVVNHVQFAQYRYQNAGKVTQVITTSDYEKCVSRVPAGSTADQIKAYCFAPGDVLSVDHRPVRLLVHVGAPMSGVYVKDPKGSGAYIGSRMTEEVGGFTGAFITGYMISRPWGQVMDPALRLGEGSIPNLAQTRKATTDSCTAITTGTIQVGGSSYTFANPLPLITAVGSVASRKYSTATPAMSACTGFRKVLPDGSLDQNDSTFAGNFTFTCENGQISVKTNSCSQMNLNSCTKEVPGSRYAEYSYEKTFLGIQDYFSGARACYVSMCNVGFQYNSLTKSCDCTFYQGENKPRLAGSVIENKCVFQTSNCPTGTVLSAGSPSTFPKCISQTLAFKTDGTEPLPSADLNLVTKNGKILGELSANAIYGVDSKGYLEFRSCLAPTIPLSGPDGDVSCIDNRPTASISSQLAMTKALSTGKLPSGVCAPGFLFDYEKKYCVASLTNCNYGKGAMGLRTFDPSAPESCRFMGCIEGYRQLNYSREPDNYTLKYFSSDPTCTESRFIQGLCEGEYITETISNAPGLITAYFCAPDGNYSVSEDGLEILRSGTSVTVPPPSKVALKTDDEILSSMNLTTKLDCGKVGGSRACQVLASVKSHGLDDLTFVNIMINPIGDIPELTLAQVTDPKIRALAPETYPLATFNCGGPDSMALDGGFTNFRFLAGASSGEIGTCINNWTKKVEVFGQCYMPNGKGIIVPGKGCLAESCLPGFALNPSRRACLNLSAPCHRPLDTEQGFLAEVNLDGGRDIWNPYTASSTQEKGAGRFSACLVHKCRFDENLTEFMDFVRPLGVSSGGSLRSSTQDFVQFKDSVSWNWSTSPWAQPFKDTLGNLTRPSATNPMYSIFSSHKFKLDGKDFVNHYADICVLKSDDSSTYLFGPVIRSHFLSSLNSEMEPKFGERCRISGMEGVYAWTSQSSFTKRLECQPVACDSENFYLVRDVNGLPKFPFQCQNIATAPPQVDRCFNQSSQFLSRDRRACLFSPINRWHPEYRYTTMPFIDGNSVLVGRSEDLTGTFHRFLPRRKTNGAYEYYDIFTGVVHNYVSGSWVPALPTTLGNSNLNWWKSFTDPALLSQTPSPVNSGQTTISYSMPTITEGVPFSVAPNVEGPKPSRYSVFVNLNELGISLDPNTGVLSGTPKFKLGQIFLTVEAEVGTTKTSAQVIFKIEGSVGNLSYDFANIRKDSPFSIPPIFTSLAASTFEIKDIMPREVSKFGMGLEINKDNGILYGVLSQNVSFRVVVRSRASTAKKEFSFNINPSTAADQVQKLMYGSYQFYKGEYVEIVPVKKAEGLSFSRVELDAASPALPSGLILNASTGVISGTLNSIQNPTVYILNVFNSGASFKTHIAFSVTYAEPKFKLSGNWNSSLYSIMYGNSWYRPYGDISVSLPVIDQNLKYCSPIFQGTQQMAAQSLPYFTVGANSEPLPDTWYSMGGVKSQYRGTRSALTLPLPASVSIQVSLENMRKFGTRDFSLDYGPLSYAITPTNRGLAISSTGQITGTMQEGVLYYILANGPVSNFKMPLCGINAKMTPITRPEAEITRAMKPNIEKVANDLLAYEMAKDPAYLLRQELRKTEIDLEAARVKVMNSDSSDTLALARFNGFRDRVADLNAQILAASKTIDLAKVASTKSIYDASVAARNQKEIELRKPRAIYPDVSHVRFINETNVVDGTVFAGSTCPQAGIEGILDVQNGFVKQTCLRSTSGLLVWAVNPGSLTCNPGTTFDPLSYPNLRCVQCLANHEAPTSNGKFVVECVNNVWKQDNLVTRNLVCNSGFSKQNEACYSNALAPRNLAYSTPNVFQVGLGITPLRPTRNGGGPVVSYEVTPALPEGLRFDSLSGEISGLPSQTFPKASFTVTAMNSIGRIESVLEIEVQGKNSDFDLRYVTEAEIQTYIRDLPIKPLQPTFRGTPEVFFARGLPPGLSINPRTGVISGTPTEFIGPIPTIVTVGARNKAGVVSTTLRILVVPAAPENLTYEMPDRVICGTPVPQLSGSFTSAFDIKFEVHTGIGLSGVTVDESGKLGGRFICDPVLTVPKDIQIEVFASNGGGVSRYRKTLKVLPPPPTQLTYTLPLAVSPLQTVGPVLPVVVGGKPAEFSVSPPLPNGFTLNKTTGAISGSSPQGSEEREYEVLAANAGGGATYKFKFAVRVAAPTGLSYGTIPKLVRTIPLTPFYPSLASGAVERFSVTPDLPQGLLLDISSGALSGMPVVTQTTPSVHTVTAHNSGGSTSTTISLSVQELPLYHFEYPTPISLVTGKLVQGLQPNYITGFPVLGSYFRLLQTLPAGLTFNSSTGAITGTPTVATALNNSTFNQTIVRANSDGTRSNFNTGVPIGQSFQVEYYGPGAVTPTSKTMFHLIVNSPQPAPIGVQYTETNLRLTPFRPVLLAPSIQGGRPREYYTESPLPAGLTLNRSTGVISGIPDGVFGPTEFTIVGQNENGLIKTKIILESIAATRVTALTYPQRTLILERGVSAVPMMPQTVGGLGSYFTVSPALPPGLSLDPYSGVISGVPSRVSLANSAHTIYVYSLCATLPKEGLASCFPANSTSIATPGAGSHASFVLNVRINEGFKAIPFVPSILEAETGFSASSIVANFGTNGTPAASALTLTSTASGNRFVSLYDVGDAIRIPITIARAGQYHFSLRVRAGDSSSTSAFILGGYRLRLQTTAGSMEIPMVGDGNSISALDPGLSGGVYWGLLKSAPLDLPAGTHNLVITATRNWGMVDAVSVLPVQGVIETDAVAASQILADPGVYPVRTATGTRASSGRAISLYDLGDKVRWTFTAPHWGFYRIHIRARMGDSSSPTAYAASAYAVTLNGSTLNLSQDLSSISPVQSDGGSVYWGLYSSGYVKLNPGTNTLDVQTNRTWAVLDGIVLEPTWGPKLTGLASNPTVTPLPTPALAKTSGGVLAPNGNLFFAPDNSDKVLVLNPQTQVQGAIATGRVGYWSAGVLTRSGLIYFLPISPNNTQLLQVNPVTNTARLVGPILTSGYKSAVVGADGFVYAFPRFGGQFIKFDGSGATPAPVYFGQNLPRFEFTALQPDGKVIGVPHVGQRVYEFNPSTSALTSWDFGYKGGATWWWNVAQEKSGQFLIGATHLYQTTLGDTNFVFIDLKNRNSFECRFKSGLYLGSFWGHIQTKDERIIITSGSENEGANQAYQFDLTVLKTRNCADLRLTAIGVTGDCRNPVADRDGNFFCAPEREGNVMRKINIPGTFVDLNPFWFLSQFFNK